MSTFRPSSVARWSCVSLTLFLVGCGSVKENNEAAEATIQSPPAASESPEGSLLAMTYEEAKAISPKSMEILPFYKVAADEIEVVKTNKDGSPRTVRAKGKVFLFIDFSEPAVALCQEAYFGESEVILRGNPLLKRGGSVIEGMAKSTVFYMLGPRLRVIGRHRVRNETQISVDLPDFRYPDSGGGPNPLLPPLSPESVPSKVRDQMLRAAEAEAVLQRSRVEPVLPLREDVMPEKLAPLLVPEDAPTPSGQAAKADLKPGGKTQPKTTADTDQVPDKSSVKDGTIPVKPVAKPSASPPPSDVVPEKKP